MELKRINIHNLDQLKGHIQTQRPSLYTASRTSTVMPYDHPEKLAQGQEDLCLVDLSNLEPKIELDDSGNMIVSGAVTWKEARAFCRSKGRMIMTSPTEDLAQLLAGVATSCTGERCFGLGTLRDQLNWVKFYDSQGELVQLSSEKTFSSLWEMSDEEKEKLLQYQKSYRPYQDFKNAPFPRFETQTDLMTGTEGQLGVIVEASMKTLAFDNLMYLFVRLPKWEQDITAHLEIFEKVQKYRGQIISCELLDENSLSYLPKEMAPYKGADLIFMEMRESDFEGIYESFISQLGSVQEEDFFSLDEAKCKELRVTVPRSIFEANSKMGVVKQGTDVQVLGEDFGALLKFYRKLAELGIEYNLFGHFGDGHLHFNFMPTPALVKTCQDALKDLYRELPSWKASPFAEHGIGLLKRPYIEAFYTPAQRPFFQGLKNKFDPHNQFFPHGFMQPLSGDQS